jgi:hypothetical protein
VRSVRIVQLRVIEEASHPSPAFHTITDGGLRPADPALPRCATGGPGRAESRLQYYRSYGITANCLPLCACSASYPQTAGGGDGNRLLT